MNAAALPAPDIGHALGLLHEHPQMTLVEVAATLGRAVSTIERAVANLQADGKLRYQGPKKGGHWEVL